MYVYLLITNFPLNKWQYCKHARGIHVVLDFFFRFSLFNYIIIMLSSSFNSLVINGELTYETNLQSIFM